MNIEKLRNKVEYNLGVLNRLFNILKKAETRKEVALLESRVKESKDYLEALADGYAVLTSNEETDFMATAAVVVLDDEKGYIVKICDYDGFNHVTIREIISIG